MLDNKVCLLILFVKFIILGGSRDREAAYKSNSSIDSDTMTVE